MCIQLCVHMYALVYLYLYIYIFYDSIPGIYKLLYAESYVSLHVIIFQKFILIHLTSILMHLSASQVFMYV